MTDQRCRNANIRGKWKERIFEVIFKPFIIGSLYFFMKIYMRRGKLPYRLSVLVTSAHRSVKDHNFIVRWIYPTAIYVFACFLYFDNAYAQFFEKTLLNYYKTMKKEKVRPYDRL